MPRTIEITRRPNTWARPLAGALLALAAAGCGEQATTAHTDSAPASVRAPAGGPAEHDSSAARAAAAVPRAAEHEHAPPSLLPGAPPELLRAGSFLTGMLQDNAHFRHANGAAHFAPLTNAQTPRATLLTCSDSRVQTPAFDERPENDLFTIRNIGNQMVTSEGSIEYGVEHLQTPVLLILGHTGCGAVKAAMAPSGDESPAVEREIASLHLPPADPGAEANAAWAAAVVANVEEQVRVALGKFDREVTAGKLVVVGAVYDLRNDFGEGYGKLRIVDVNGERDPEQLRGLVKALGAARE